jgi:hypothetical protein
MEFYKNHTILYKIYLYLVNIKMSKNGNMRPTKKVVTVPTGGKKSQPEIKKTFQKPIKHPHFQKEIDNIIQDKDATYVFEPKNQIPDKIIKKEQYLTSFYEVQNTLKTFYSRLLNSGNDTLTGIYWKIIKLIKENSLNMPPPSQRDDMGKVSIVNYEFFYEDKKPAELYKYVPSRVIKKIIGGDTNIRIKYIVPNFLKEYFYTKLLENEEDLKDLEEEEQLEIKKEIENSISKKIEDKILEKGFPEYVFEYEGSTHYKLIIPSKIIQKIGENTKEFFIDSYSDVGKYFAEKVFHSYTRLMDAMSEFNYKLTKDQIRSILSYRTELNETQKEKLEKELEKRVISNEEKERLSKELEEFQKTEFERIKKKIQTEIKYHIEENTLYHLKPRWYSVFQFEEEDVPKYKSIDKFGRVVYNYYYTKPPQKKISEDKYYYEQAPPENYEEEPFYITLEYPSSEEEYDPEYELQNIKSPYKRYDIRNTYFPGDIPSLLIDMKYDRELNYHIDELIYVWVGSNNWKECERIYIYPKNFLNFNTEKCSEIKNYFKIMYSEENIIPKIVEKYPLCKLRINKKTIHIPKVNMSTRELYDYLCLNINDTKNVSDIIIYNNYYKTKSFIRKLYLYNSSIISTEIGDQNLFQEYITLWMIEHSINKNPSIRILFQPNNTNGDAKTYVNQILDVQFNFDNQLNLKHQDNNEFLRMVEKCIYNDNIEMIIFFVTFNADDDEIDSKYVLCILLKSKHLTLNKSRDGGNVYIFDPLGRTLLLNEKYKKIYNTIISAILPRDILWDRVISKVWNPSYSFLTYEEIEHVILTDGPKFSPQKIQLESIKWCLWFIDLILENGADDFGVICTSGLNHVAKYRKHDIYFKDYIDKYITFKMIESQKYKSMLENKDKTDVHSFVQKYFRASLE